MFAPPSSINMKPRLGDCKSFARCASSALLSASFPEKEKTSKSQDDVYDHDLGTFSAQQPHDGPKRCQGVEKYRMVLGCSDIVLCVGLLGSEIARISTFLFSSSQPNILTCQGGRNGD